MPYNTRNVVLSQQRTQRFAHGQANNTSTSEQKNTITKNNKKIAILCILNFNYTRNTAKFLESSLPKGQLCGWTWSLRDRSLGSCWGKITAKVR